MKMKILFAGVTYPIFLPVRSVHHVHSSQEEELGLSRPVRCCQPLLAPFLCSPGVEASLETQKIPKLWLNPA